jgi:hypothetical protein
MKGQKLSMDGLVRLKGPYSNPAVQETMARLHEVVFGLEKQSQPLDVLGGDRTGPPAATPKD